MLHRASLFERLFIRQDRRWLALGAAVALWLIPFVGAALAADPRELLQSERWRGLLVAPTMIVYVVVVSPWVERAWQRVYSSLRPVVIVADDAYVRLLAAALALSPRSELIVFAVGAFLGFLRVGFTVEGAPTWLDVYLVACTALLFGLLAWVIYITVARTQVTATLLRQPLAVDPNDITAFLAIGQQALLLALVFVGGITLSLLSSALEPGVFLQIGFWLVYVPIALAPVAVFFLTMRPTHRVLAGAKLGQLEALRAELRRACRRLLDCLAQDQDPGNLPQQVSALIAMEQRLQTAPTWPYDTAMLRTLFVSVLAPAILLLVRWIIEHW
jgi:hypothetical protein